MFTSVCTYLSLRELKLRAFNDAELDDIQREEITIWLSPKTTSKGRLSIASNISNIYLLVVKPFLIFAVPKFTLAAP
jgi:hypothetical protein